MRRSYAWNFIPREQRRRKRLSRPFGRVALILGGLLGLSALAGALWLYSH